MSTTDGTTKRNSYSYLVLFAYAFNILVGTGVLAFPRVFNQTGLVLGIILLTVICLTGYVTNTYVIEALAAANAYSKLIAKKKTVMGVTNKMVIEEAQENSETAFTAETSLSTTEDETLETSKNCNVAVNGISLEATDKSDEDYFEIVENYEYGAMANIFFPRFGIVLCYLAVCLQLVGDVTIHAVIATTSLTQTVCDLVNYYGNNESYSIIDNCDIEDNVTTSLYISDCFGGLSKQHVYYIFLAVFYIIIGPFTYFNITKTKWLQIITNICRYVAFGAMMILTFIRIGQGNTNIPEVADIQSLPILFGITVYSFNIHNLLPGIVTPLKSKKRVNWVLSGVYATVLILYLTIAITGSFAFRVCEMNDLYNLDFFDPGDSIIRLIVGTYLALFPFFVLSTRFPLNSISLRENLKSLSKEAFKPCVGDKGLPKIMERIIFGTVAIIPAIIISFSTQQNSLLISVTGTFPGVGIQYLIPAGLVIMSRRTLLKRFGSYENKHKSPFSHFILVGVVVVLGFICVVLIIVSMIFNPPALIEYPIR